MWFNADFSFSEHVNKFCKASLLHRQNLHRIRWFLTQEVAVLAANALVSSRLDYCNSLSGGFSCFNRHKLHSVQNILARIVTNHVTPIQKLLHWLPANTAVCPKPEYWFLYFYTVVLLAILDDPCLLEVTPTAPVGKSSKLTCWQKPINHRLPVTPMSSWYDLAMLLDL